MTMIKPMSEMKPMGEKRSVPMSLGKPKERGFETGGGCPYAGMSELDGLNAGAINK